MNLLKRIWLTYLCEVTPFIGFVERDSF